MAPSFVDYPNWMGFSSDGLSLSGAPEPGASPTNKIKQKDQKETLLLYIYTFQFGGFHDELATQVQYTRPDEDERMDENARVRWEIRRSSPIILTQSKPSLQFSQRLEACEHWDFHYGWR